ncbi:MAG: CTP synthase [Alphaproteobacteria bacterium]|nr:CTP synthase [Alphaproteobacteria bacterium]
MTNQNTTQSKYIFVTGGVLSSLGKGTFAASLGTLLKASDFSVRLCKVDPYLNVDPGTMNPFEHGEVFVTKDGGETDLDFGHYERFTGIDSSAHDSTTTGKIFSNIIAKERKGGYKGETVQIIPHFVQEVHTFLRKEEKHVDFTICEVGGTIGDIESQSFVEAIRQMRVALNLHTMFVHVVPIYYLKTTDELKSKPAQHSVRQLLGYGLQPDLLCCRTNKPLPKALKTKLGVSCNLSQEKIITGRDADIIYEVPLTLEKEGLLSKTLNHFDLPQRKANMRKWTQLIRSIKDVQEKDTTVNIAFIGKYIAFQDTYRSLNEAIWHASIHEGVRVNSHWIHAEDLDDSAVMHKQLAGMDAILVPGGFGVRGFESKVAVADFACENNVPFFGICLGLQALIFAIARHVDTLQNPLSEELHNDGTGEMLIHRLQEWKNVYGKKEVRVSSEGYLRLGNLPIHLTHGSLAHRTHKSTCIHERHRHRYHVNQEYMHHLSDHLLVSGKSEEGIIEIVEHTVNSFCVGVQYHPEFNSNPFEAHPLFCAFLQAAKEYKKRS